LTFGRERAHRERLADLARLVPGESALDGGCGTGSLPSLWETTGTGQQRSRHGPTRRSASGEIEILEYVSRGRTNKDIGSERFISEATVKTHLLHIFAKLDVQDRTQAVTVALDRGILRLDVWGCWREGDSALLDD